MPSLFSKVIVRFPFRADGCADHFFSELLRLSSTERIVSMSLSFGSFSSSSSIRSGSIFALSQSKRLLTLPLAMRVLGVSGPQLVAADGGLGKPRLLRQVELRHSQLLASSPDPRAAGSPHEAFLIVHSHVSLHYRTISHLACALSLHVFIDSFGDLRLYPIGDKALYEKSPKQYPQPHRGGASRIA